MLNQLGLVEIQKFFMTFMLFYASEILCLQRLQESSIHYF